MSSGIRATAYSACIAAAVCGTPQRGVIHSVFAAAANIAFPPNFVLSLNCAAAPRMPNGLQLSAAAGAFPFSALRPGMPALLGAQCLHIEAIQCSLDLSMCHQWDAHIERPEHIDLAVVKKNGEWLGHYVGSAPPLPFPQGDRKGKEVWETSRPYYTRNVEIHRGIVALGGSTTDLLAMATYLCGRGVGLTPTGDDMLAGWMAIGWLLYGPLPSFLEACQYIVRVAERQTHLLSQCWLGYAAAGDVAEPIRTLLVAMTQDESQQLTAAADAVLGMGATSGYDIIQGMLLGLRGAPLLP